MERYCVIILGMAIVTYIPRFLPMFVLTRVRIPEIVISWLRYLPVSVLAALIVPGIVADADRQMNLSADNAYLPASILVFFLARRFKNMLLTVTAGMAAVFILRMLY